MHLVSKLDSSGSEWASSHVAWPANDACNHTDNKSQKGTSAITLETRSIAEARVCAIDDCQRGEPVWLAPTEIAGLAISRWNRSSCMSHLLGMALKAGRRGSAVFSLNLAQAAVSNETIVSRPGVEPDFFDLRTGSNKMARRAVER